MRLVRTIHQKYYDSELGRFTSLAFKPASNGGISVFDCECAMRRSGTLCSHISQFYAEVSGAPPIFWVFDTGILPADLEIQNSVSTSGDSCHRDIHNLSAKQARGILKSVSVPNDFCICNPDGSCRVLTMTDLQAP